MIKISTGTAMFTYDGSGKTSKAYFFAWDDNNIWLGETEKEMHTALKEFVEESDDDVMLVTELGKKLDISTHKFQPIH